MRRVVFSVVAACFVTGCQVAFPLDGYSTPRCLICEDFEGGTLDGWSPQLSGGTVTLTRASDDAAHVHGGEFSAHCTIDPVAPTQTNTAELQRSIDGKLPPQLFVRLFMFHKLAGTGVGAGAIVLQSSRDGFSGASLNWGTGNLQLTNWATQPNANHTQSGPYPFDRWVCIEWAIDFDAQQMRVFRDGVELPELRTIGETVPDDDRFLFGAAYALPSTAPMEVWFDDVQVRNQPVGCGP
jgi:hypothetical protein